MSDRTFVVTVLEDFCKGCGLCVEFCEHGGLYIRQKPNKQGIQTAAVHPGAEADCTGCRRCAMICPDAAIEISCVEDASEAEDAVGSHGK